MPGDFRRFWKPKHEWRAGRSPPETSPALHGRHRSGSAELKICKKIADERLPSRHTRMLGNAENDEVPGFFRRRWAMHLVGVRGAQPAVTAQVLQAREGGLVGARCHSVTLPLFFNKNARNLAPGLPLQTAARRFMRRLLCPFLLRWRSLEWNFVLCQEFFRCRRSPRPNGWKLPPGTSCQQ